MDRSNSTTPRLAPSGFTGQNGTVWICPESAIAANQGPLCGRLSQSRMMGFSPFEALM
jgi:hypothetical protein